MIARVATAVPIEAVVNGLPFGASTAAPAFRQRSASRMSAVMPRSRARGLGDPIVGGVEGVRHRDPLDQRVFGDADALVADDRDRHLAAVSDLVDLVLYGTGIGIDQDARHRAIRKG
jgi:hypothetical protein